MFKFCEFILTFGYLGKFKKAPGTYGSIGGMIFWLIFTKIFFLENFTIIFQNFLWIIIAIIMTIFAIKKINFYITNLAKKINKAPIADNQTIVLDEVVGQILTLQISLNAIGESYFSQPIIAAIHLLISLILFRFFDIKKPWIIGIIDKKLKNSFGVMFDDIIAGTFAGFAGSIILYYINYNL